MGLFSKSSDSAKVKPLYAYSASIDEGDYGYHYAKGDLERISDVIKENHRTTSDAHEGWANKRSGLTKWSMVGLALGATFMPALVIPALAIAAGTMAWDLIQKKQHKKFTRTASTAVDRLERAQTQLGNSRTIPFSDLATALGEHQERMQSRYDVNNAWSLLHPDDSYIEKQKAHKRENLERLNIVNQRRQVSAYNQNVGDMIHNLAVYNGQYFNQKNKKAQNESVKKAKKNGFKTTYGTAA